MILSSQLNEEIERIRFISNYDPTKLVTEQKSSTPSSNPQTKLTPEQIQAAKQKIQQQANTSAREIYDELMKAFDMDGDKDLRDWDGTNESAALNAIKKIKNKETLDALNKIIKSWKQFNGLKSWLNSEMSDFDSEYGHIWSKLEKMGYAGANYNMLLKVAGDTGPGLLIKGVDKAIDTLRGMTIDQIMEGFRDLVMGVGGTVVQALLTLFGGPIGAGINAFAWAALTIYDINKASKGDVNMWNIIIDLFSLITNGIAARSMTTAKLTGAEVRTVGSTISALAQKSPKIYQYVKSLGQNLSSWGGKIVSMIENALKWLVSKLPSLKGPLNDLRSAMSKISEYLLTIGKAIKDPIGSKVVTNLASKGLTKVGVSSFVMSKIGQEGLLKFEKDVVKKVVDYCLKYVGNYADESIKTQVCKMGTQYCSVYKTIEKGVLSTMAAGSATAGAGNIGKNTALSNTKNSIEDLTKGVTDLEKGTENINKLL